MALVSLGKFSHVLLVLFFFRDLIWNQLKGDMNFIENEVKEANFQLAEVSVKIMV